jgi:CMP-N-acetylneuraminic acid synthetase
VGNIQHILKKLKKMIDEKKILAVIPARGGSKGVPRKNIRELAGKPLIAWTIEAAKKSKYIDRLILTSEDPEIIEVAKFYGCEVPFVRAAELAQDDTPGIEVVLDAVQRCPGFTHVLLLQPTSPFRTHKHIDDLIEEFNQKKINCLVSVTMPGKHPMWSFSMTEKNMLSPFFKDTIPSNRQALPTAYVLNGALYLSDINWLRVNRSFISSETNGFLMSPESSMDIDTELDFEICTYLMKKTDLSPAGNF